MFLRYVKINVLFFPIKDKIYHIPTYFDFRRKEKNQRLIFIFQVFVANPNKPKPILDILLRNQDKLIDFLSKFHNDRTDDEQFNDEKAYLIKQIKELKPLPE